MYKKWVNKVNRAFWDNKIVKHKFHGYKYPIFSEDVHTDNILTSKKIFSGERNYKYFIGYINGYYKFKPLHIMVPKTNTYLKCYDGETKWIHFLIECN